MDEENRKKLLDEILQREEDRKKIMDRIEHGSTVPQSRELYAPRTAFLKGRIAKSHFSNKNERKYIEALCKIEDKAYRRQVLHESPGFYGPYSLLYGEQFGAYREEYFAMLKELSYPDYIRVLVDEISAPDECGGWKDGKQIRLPAGLSEADRKALLERKEKLDNERAKERNIERECKNSEKKKYSERSSMWWVRNGGSI
jgi:hypothetical protein